VPLSETGAYSVAFDPLDGSSIVGANFAVGSIFGIWRGATPLGQTGRAQAAAVYSVYGPRTLLVVAYEDARGDKAVQQFVQQPLHKQQQQQQHPEQQQQQQHYRWALQRAYASLRRAKVVAPANLRAAAGNAAYRALVDRWILDGRKLRYSGGMVPDVHHILVKVRARGSRPLFCCCCWWFVVV
jgi:fructose-1,6-bisphosphatase